jgi:predicted phage tail protein
MKRRIILHGYLKKLIPGSIELAVETVVEAIEALCVVTGRALHPNPKTGRHRIACVGFDSLDAMRSPLGDDVEELHLIPAFAGGKSGGILQIIVGVVIIVAAILLSPYTGGASSILTEDGAYMVGMMGASMILGGILALVSPSPKNNTNSGPAESLYLGTPQNTTKIGTPIPIGYGMFRVYGQILSADIEATDMSLATPSTTPTAPTGAVPVFNKYGVYQ